MAIMMLFNLIFLTTGKNMPHKYTEKLIESKEDGLSNMDTIESVLPFARALSIFMIFVRIPLYIASYKRPNITKSYIYFELVAMAF